MIPLRTIFVALCGVALLSSCQAPEGALIEPQVFPQADYEVRLRPGENLAEVEVAFDVQRGQESLRVPVLPRDVSLLDWQSGEGRIVAEGPAYVLVLEGPRAAHVRLRFVVPVTSPSPGVNELTLPTLMATRGRMTVRLPPRTGDFTVAPQAVVWADAATDGERLIRLYPPASQTLTLRWQQQAAAAIAEAGFIARSQEQIQVKRGLVVRRTQLTCEVRKGALGEFRVALPPGLLVRAVDGPTVLDWRSTESGAALAVTLARTVKDQVSFQVQSEEARSAEAAAVSIVPVAVLGADLQQGSLRLEPAEGLVLQEVSVQGASRAANLPGQEQTALCYDYSALPVLVRVEAVERPARLAVRTETLVVLEAGLMALQARLHYEVEYRAVRSVAIGIPAGATVLDVSGEAVRDWELAGPEQLLVRFSRAVLGPQDVSLRLQQNLQQLDGIAIPRLAPAGVESDEGLIGVSAGEGVELRHYRSALTEQIDAGGLPEWLRQGKAKLAYRYRRPGGTLAVSTEKILPRVTARTAELVDLEQDVLLRTFRLDAEVEQAEIFEILLRLPRELTPLRVGGEAVESWELRPGPQAPMPQPHRGQGQKSELRVALKKGCLGPLSLTVECSVAADYGQAVKIESIDVPGAHRLSGVLVVAPHADVSLKPGAASGLRPRAVAEVAAAQAPAAARGLPAGSVAYEFDGPWLLTLNVEELRPQVAATAVTLLRVRDGQVSAETALECDIQEAGLSQLQVRLPVGAVNSWVDGPGISSRRLEKDPAGDTWRVALDRRYRGAYRLRVTYDCLMPAGSAEMKFTEARLLGAGSQKGFVVIGKAQPSISLTVRQEGFLRLSDLAALPRWHGLNLNVPVAEVYEYSGGAGQDWHLALHVQRLAEADVQQIQATDCLMQTLLCPDGTALTFMTLTVENTGRQFVKVPLLAGRVLWAAYVDGRPVKPAESGEAQTYLIPLGGLIKRAGTFEIMVVFGEQYAPLGGRTVDLAFKSPGVDVPTGSMTWAVYLPPGYHLMPQLGRTAGNMELLWEPPEAAAPVHQELFSTDASRWHSLWPVVRPYVPAALYVALGLAGLLLAALCAHLTVRVILPALRRRAARARARAAQRTVPTIRSRRPLRWAALAIPVVILVLLLGLVMLPSLHQATPVRLAASGAADLRTLGQALDAYYKTYNEYPASLSDLAERNVLPQDAVKRFEAEGLEYLGGDKKADVGGNVVLGYLNTEGGYQVLKNDGTAEWVSEGDRRNLAGQLWRQGDVDAPLVKEDLTLSETEQADYARRYELAKRLQARSRANVDELLSRSVRAQLEQKAKDRYATGDSDAEAAAGRRGGEQGEAGLEDQQGQKMRESKALAAQTSEILKEAQQKAGVTVTATPPPSAAAGPPAAESGPGEMPAKPAEPPKPPDGHLASPVEPAGQLAEPPPPETKPVRQPWEQWASEAGYPAVFAPVVGGRSKGALPIGLRLPDIGTAPYLFGRAFTGSAVGQFQVTAARGGTSYTAYSIICGSLVGLVVAAGGLVGGWLLRRRRATAA